MLNYEKFSKENQPTEVELRDFVGADFFADLDKHLREHYNTKPKYAYSNCAMDGNIWRGWNIKYQKSGKSLCTLYPQQGYFLVLIPGKWFEVRNEGTVDEVKVALEIRMDEIRTKSAKKS